MKNNNLLIKAGKKVALAVLAAAMLVSPCVTYDVSAEGVYPENGWYEEYGKKHWYEDGVRQGVKYNEDKSLDLSYRGKEIYDPESDAWYWLDNVQHGAMAVSKDVYQESWAGEWGDYVGEDGRLYGKWVRYDENGHMIKGWQTTDKGTYYFDLTTGAMAKGDVVIDEKKYSFDKETGVLVGSENKSEVDSDVEDTESTKEENKETEGTKAEEAEKEERVMDPSTLENLKLAEKEGKTPDNGWYECDGWKFWYEDGIRQGLEGRGKEIYDPKSDAWYWLDSVNGGAVAVSKDVYQESWAGAFAENEDGTGKWVRYDENGHMVKGWDIHENGDAWYFDTETGAMAKGWQIPQEHIRGGENELDAYFKFDENTGVLNRTPDASELPSGTCHYTEKETDAVMGKVYLWDEVNGGWKEISREEYEQMIKDGKFDYNNK